MYCVTDDYESDDCSEYVELDPTGRYGRYNEILGKGASKIVYRGFDEYEGIEVAWNQVKLTDLLQRPEDLERLYSEIHLLKTLNHKNIMKFYTSWVDTANRNINFVTEMFTSGTLREYRMKHKRVNIRAVKHWCRQILEGLCYLHSLDPPVIHRDLKCDNIFINGNQGKVKIGDLGLAAILNKSHSPSCVGTPEFMAPEVYAEEYNELVDIYSFGMCVLEMVTFEYPYSECTHPAQIYKKVTSGKKPDSLYKVKDPEVRLFIEKCLATASDRLSAKQLLEDPFLRSDNEGYDPKHIILNKEFDKIHRVVQLQYQNDSCLTSNLCDYDGDESAHEYEYETFELGANEIELFTSLEDEHETNMGITIKGKRTGNADIFLRLRITDEEGRIRNIYFPFDTDTDTALSVATEMVAELDIKEKDVTSIAQMIDGEIASLVPDWKEESSVEEADKCTIENCDNIGVPNFSLADYISLDKPLENIRLLRCSSHRSTASMRGRFEEITYQLGETENDGIESGVIESTDNRIWAHHDRRPSRRFHFDEACIPHDQSDRRIKLDGQSPRCYDKDLIPRTPYNSPGSSVLDDHEYQNEIRKELRWLRAKYEMQLRERPIDQELSSKVKSLVLAAEKDYQRGKRDTDVSRRSNKRGLDANDLKNALEKHFPTHFSGFPPRLRQRNEFCSPEHMKTARRFNAEGSLPHSLQRSTSLPVDALDC